MQKKYERRRVFCRYVPNMKYFRSFLVMSVVTFNVVAQPAPGRDTDPAQAALEQRRAELRLVLKATRRGEVQADTPDSAPANRHLSMQERADLRQQLRQQRRDGKPE